MPKRVTTLRPVDDITAATDGVLTVDQAYELGLTRGSINHELAKRRWQRPLPGVLLLQPTPPTRRQRLFIAAAWAGPRALVDSHCACQWFGLESPQFRPDVVHLVAPYGASVRTRDFVVVRRSDHLVVGGRSERLGYVDAATAVAVAARGMSEAAAAGLASRALQRRLVTVDDLVAAHMHAPPKGSAGLSKALEGLAVGVRSAAELDARRLVARSRVLPEPLWNCWLDLGDGGPLISPDALWPHAALMQETNGRDYHAWALAFEQMQARHDRATAAGLVVLHVTPRQLRREPDRILDLLERSYLRYAGRGLPAGVRIVRTEGVSARTAG
jgi:hypothetical protein